MDLDEHLVVRGNGSRHVLDAQHIRWTVAIVNDRPHALTNLDRLHMFPLDRAGRPLAAYDTVMTTLPRGWISSK